MKPSTMTQIDQTDIAIIGAGPVGLFSVFECGMLKMNCHVFDTLDDIGGQCIALYPEKPIYDIPAHPAIMAADLIAHLQEQIKPFNPTFHLGSQVTHIEKMVDGWLLKNDRGVQVQAKAIMLAAGAGAFGPKKPPLENLESYEGKSVFYYVKSKEKFKGKRIVIAGGGDSAVDWAISLSDIAEKIYFVHRRPKYRAAPESVAQLEKIAATGKIEFIVPYQLSALEGQNGELTAVIVEDLEGQKRTLEADTLLPFFGLAMELGPIADWGLGLERSHIAVNPTTLETNQSRIYAVGDIATYAGKLKLILCGFSETAMAAHHAYKYVYPDHELHFEYSTSKGIHA